MKEICPKIDCTGCQACRVACAKNAISMQEDNRGHIYPVIDANLCIDCGKCQKICPSINPPSFNNAPIKVYAAHSKDFDRRHYSTSGGISYELSKSIIEAGGYFCGVIWTMDGAKHRLTNKLEELKEFQGSKYSHSDVGNVYVDIRDLLKQGEAVLFTGTPCQCAALRKFLVKPYDNLFIVDLVCHGVPSRRVLRDSIREVEQRNSKKVTYLRFRDKQPNQLSTYMKYVFEDGTCECQKYTESFFFRSFVDDYILRENCYRCPYSRSERVSDLTIADFWGYHPIKWKFRNCWEGISIAIVNNEQGKALFSRIEKSIQFEERTLEENANQNLHAPQPKPNNFENYWEDYENEVAYDLIRKRYLSKPDEYNPTLKQRIIRDVKLLLPPGTLSLFRTIKKQIRK